MILNNKRFRRTNNTVIATLEIKSFPLPNIIVKYQYIGRSKHKQAPVQANYHAATLQRNTYTYSPQKTPLTVRKKNRERIRIQWWHPYSSFFSMQVIFITYNASSLRKEYHKIYSHSGKHRNAAQIPLL